MSDLSISNRPYTPTPTTACGVAAQGALHLAQGKAPPAGLSRTAGAAMQCGLEQLGKGMARLTERQVADGLRQTMGGKLTEGQIGKLAKLVTNQGGPHTPAGRTLVAMITGNVTAFQKTNNFFLKLGGYADKGSAASTAAGAVLDLFPRAGTVNAGLGTLLSWVGVPLTMNGIGYMRLDGERRAKLEGPLKAMVNVMRHLEQNGGSMRDVSRLRSAHQQAFPEAHFGRAFEGRSAFAACYAQPAGLKAYDAECRHWYEKLQSMPEGDREAFAKDFKAAMQTLHGVGDWSGIERALRQKAGL
jgi:hypothetical protein